MTPPTRRTPPLIRPIAAAWYMAYEIMRVTGRILAALAGVAIATIGFFLSLTLIGAFLGVPLVIFGILLVARSVFG